MGGDHKVKCEVCFCQLCVYTCVERVYVSIVFILYIDTHTGEREREPSTLHPAPCLPAWLASQEVAVDEFAGMIEPGPTKVIISSTVFEDLPASHGTAFVCGQYTHTPRRRRARAPAAGARALAVARSRERAESTHSFTCLRSKFMLASGT